MADREKGLFTIEYHNKPFKGEPLKEINLLQ